MVIQSHSFGRNSSKHAETQHSTSALSARVLGDQLEGTVHAVLVMAVVGPCEKKPTLDSGLSHKPQAMNKTIILNHDQSNLLPGPNCLASLKRLYRYISSMYLKTNG